MSINGEKGGDVRMRRGFRTSSRGRLVAMLGVSSTGLFEGRPSSRP